MIVCETEELPENATVAQRLVREILLDITSREGFDEDWEGVDVCTQRSIERDLVDIANDCLKQLPGNGEHPSFFERFVGRRIKAVWPDDSSTTIVCRGVVDGHWLLFKNTTDGSDTYIDASKLAVIVDLGPEKE